jgi:hypothetical protein
VWTAVHVQFPQDFRYAVDTSLLMGDQASLSVQQYDLGSLATFQLTTAAGVTASDGGDPSAAWVPVLSLVGSLDNLNTALATVQFAAPEDRAGTVTITVTVSDLGHTGSGDVGVAIASVAVVVERQHAPPQITLRAPKYAQLALTSSQAVYMVGMNEDSELSLTDIVVEDDDILVDGGLLHVTYTARFGWLALQPNDEDGDDGDDGDYTTAITVDGTLAELAELLPRLVYRPPEDWNGDDVLNISVATTAAVAAASLSASVSSAAWEILVVHVAAVNDPPYLSCPQHLEVSEDATLGFTVELADADLAASTLWKQLAISVRSLAVFHVHRRDHHIFRWCWE